MIERKRDVAKLIYFSEDELDKVYENMKEVGISNFSHYARRMLTNGQIVQVNLSELRELNKNIGQIGNNLNQLAREANSAGMHPAGLYQALDEWKEFKSYYTEIINKLVVRTTKL